MGEPAASDAFADSAPVVLRVSVADPLTGTRRPRVRRRSASIPLTGLNSRAVVGAALIALLIGTAWLTASAVGFGFIWDDPHWFGRVVGKSWREILQPAADFHFYRPGTMAYIRLFLQGDGTFAAPAIHWLQTCWYLLNVAFSFALGRRLGLPRGAAGALAALVALFPFSYQAVAWAAPQQPVAFGLLQGSWLAYLYARLPARKAAKAARPIGRGPLALSLSLLFFWLALTVQEVALPMAFVPLLLELGLRRGVYRGRASAATRSPLSASAWRRVLAYPLLATLYGALWLQAPRQAGITGWLFDGQVAQYLLQGFIYPLLGRPGGYAPGAAPPDGALIGLAALVLPLGLGLAWWRGRAELALIGVAWALLGMAPTAVGLPYDYVALAPRLLYYSAPGVALLWVTACWPSRSTDGTYRLPQVAGLLILAFVAVQSSVLLVEFRSLYQRGTDHLNELLTAVGDEDGRYLFINFPDRFAPKRAPYPLGYWGVTLAPVSVDLGAFPAMLAGHQPQTTSISLPWIDADARAAGPDAIDLRGVITPPGKLYELAAKHDRVYVSRGMADGDYALRPAGSLQVGMAPPCRLAVFGESVCLHGADVSHDGEVLRLRLAWSTSASLAPHLTIFAHVGRPGESPLAQADGDSWQGALPLAIWRPGDLIHDERTIPRPQSDEPLFLILGIYDWVSGQRLPVADAQGHPLAGYGYVVPLP